MSKTMYKIHKSFQQPL